MFNYFALSLSAFYSSSSSGSFGSFLLVYYTSWCSALVFCVNCYRNALMRSLGNEEHCVPYLRCNRGSLWKILPHLTFFRCYKWEASMHIFSAIQGKIDHSFCFLVIGYSTPRSLSSFSTVKVLNHYHFLPSPTGLILKDYNFHSYVNDKSLDHALFVPLLTFSEHTEEDIHCICKYICKGITMYCYPLLGERNLTVAGFLFPDYHALAVRYLYRITSILQRLQRLLSLICTGLDQLWMPHVRVAADCVSYSNPGTVIALHWWDKDARSAGVMEKKPGRRWEGGEMP